MNIVGNILIYSVLGLLAIVIGLIIAVLIKRLIKWLKTKRKKNR